MFNLVVISGRLTADPELKTTPNGVSVCAFTIANETGYGENKSTNFINVVAWRKQAEVVSKHFRKGSLIGIEGAIQTRKFTDKNGNNRTAFEIVVNNIQFLEPKKNDVMVEGNSTPTPKTDPMVQFKAQLDKANEFKELGNIPEGDLPF